MSDFQYIIEYHPEKGGLHIQDAGVVARRNLRTILQGEEPPGWLFLGAFTDHRVAIERKREIWREIRAAKQEDDGDGDSRSG